MGDSKSAAARSLTMPPESILNLAASAPARLNVGAVPSGSVAVTW